MSEFIKCPECDGRGMKDGWRYVVMPEESHIYVYQCPVYIGSGKVVNSVSAANDDKRSDHECETT